MSSSASVSLDARAPRILIVDDESDNRELLDLVLVWEGFLTSSAASGAEALAMVARGEPPDLVLLDIMMPCMTGYEVVARLKADPATRDIPVIMISALTDGKAKALAAGAEAFLPKPLDRDDLVQRVRQLLRKTSPGDPETEN